MTKKLLCATDFSDPANRAAGAAAALAAKFGDPLVLLHAFDPPAAAGKDLIESLRSAARETLAAEAERLRKSGVVVEEKLLEGSPYEAVASIVEGTPIRLVVMASQKKRSLAARWFFGGVTERVIKTSSVPCLVLRDPDFVEAWLTGCRSLRVFVAADLSSSPDAPLLFAGELSRIGPCEITVAYVNWIPEEATRLGLGNTPEALLEGSHRLQAMLENELRGKADRLLGDVPVTVRVEPRWGRADLPLIGMAELSHTDLFVVGARAKGGFARFFEESVSLGVLHHAPMAVATVPLHSSLADVPPPPSFERVFVATDFSETANHAIPYACSMTAPGGVLCLAHVAEPLGLGEAEAQRLLNERIPHHAAARGIRCETLVWHGKSPAEDLVHLAEQFRADAICIGSQGRSAVSRALLGSVARAVLDTSRCPVLVVRKPG